MLEIIFWIVSLVMSVGYLFYYLIKENLVSVSIRAIIILFILMMFKKLKIRYKIILFLLGIFLLRGIFGLLQIVAVLLLFIWTVFVFSGGFIFGFIFPVGIFAFHIITEIKGWELAWWKCFIFGGLWGLLSMILSFLTYFLFDIPLILSFSHAKNYLFNRILRRKS